MDAPRPGDGAERSILGKLLFNQYQAIVLLGVGAAAYIGSSPWPLLVWLGAQLALLPLLDSGPLRRLLAQRRMRLQRGDIAASRASAMASLERTFLPRFQAMQALCSQVEGNYRQLNGLSQAYLHEQRGKLDVILDGCLHRLLALQRYGAILERRAEPDVLREIDSLRRELANAELPERARAAIQKNIQLKQRLHDSLREARGTIKALATELDSMQSLLELLHQNSISMHDPQAVSQELDVIARQSEDSGRVVREMEALMRAGGFTRRELAHFPAEDPQDTSTPRGGTSVRARERQR
ncbi:MAG: hypothetical protein RL026_1756 [Pseudomonadota bacterium]|jgi:hypothetical protein